MGAMMRALDWSRTPLGPPEGWPQSLRTSVSTCLDCAFPILVWWGPQLAMLYNDEYAQILGPQKHPRGLGAPGQTVWPEIWDVIGPMLRQVMDEGIATRSRDLHLVMNRLGFDEETYFSFSYSPIRDESGGVGGIFTPVIETTQAVVGARRLRTLREVAARSNAADMPAVCRGAVSALAENLDDAPFVLIYGLPAEGAAAELWAASGLSIGHDLAPSHLALEASAPWPLAKVLQGAGAATVAGLRELHPVLHEGPWPEPPREALIYPLSLPGSARPFAVMIAGVNPRRPLDAEHRGFFDLVAGEITGSCAEAAALEEERRRAAALAELDRAKTVFFSNVSHELRTPLTLILSPIQALLQSDELAPAVREDLSLVGRNAERLLKLVNGLLDFSRIEAGRQSIDLRATDVAALTTDLISNFRAATERAGLDLTVVCEDASRPVLIDPELWEKIVLNLVSNAFKYTLEGGITVRLAERGDRLTLEVADTGVGIAKEDLPRLFERFQRVDGVAGRSFEGSGIGLALVKELAALHGGEVAVQSTPGAGSTFTVSIPVRRGDDRAAVAAPTDRAGVFVQEALGWIGEEPALSSGLPAALEGPGRRVALVDDNADMRRYMTRVLTAEGYAVDAYAEAGVALDALVARPPDLLISDVMMPGLDGFELLSRVRADEATAGLPVVLVSARAGEEATIEGLEAGADGYLVKPFSARELLARVRSALALADGRAQVAAARREQSERIWRLLEGAPVFFCLLAGPEHRFEFFNSKYQDLVGGRAVIGRSVAECLPEVVDQGFIALLDGVFTSATPYHGDTAALRLAREGRLDEVFVDFIYQPLREEGDRVTGVFVIGMEVTERAKALERQRFLINELNHRVKNSLFTAQSIIGQTLRNAPSSSEVGPLVEDRLQSLARAHDTLSRESWAGADLKDVVQRALEPFGAGGRLRASGPAAWLTPNQALTLTLVLHELATNAAKYGALSRPGGAVDVAWAEEMESGEPHVRLVWRERGGPPVAPPTRRGFGSRLIERALGAELGGRVRLDYAVGGVVCELRLPLSDKAAPLLAMEAD